MLENLRVPSRYWEYLTRKKPRKALRMLNAKRRKQISYRRKGWYKEPDYTIISPSQ